jgi:hypothetical protein
VACEQESCGSNFLSFFSDFPPNLSSGNRGSDPRTSQFKAIIHGQYENSLKRGEHVNSEEQKLRSLTCINDYNTGTILVEGARVGLEFFRVKISGCLGKRGMVHSVEL